MASYEGVHGHLVNNYPTKDPNVDELRCICKGFKMPLKRPFQPGYLDAWADHVEKVTGTRPRRLD